MQQKELNELTQRYIRKLPFVKALILSELTEGVEVFKYVADDIKFAASNTQPESYLKILRAAMTELYSDFKNQFSKVSECNNFKISLMFDQYFVQKVQIGRNLLLVIICETVSSDGQESALDIGQLDLMVDEYKRNFQPVDAYITELNKDD